MAERGRGDRFKLFHRGWVTTRKLPPENLEAQCQGRRSNRRPHFLNDLEQRGLLDDHTRRVRPASSTHDLLPGRV